MKAMLVAIAIAASAAGARADSALAPPKARELAADGRAAHDRGDYTHAIIAFKDAYVIAPAPALLFNLAQSYRLLGNCAEAATMYRRYLDSGPDLEARAIAEMHLAAVERCERMRSLHIPLDGPSPIPVPDARGLAASIPVSPDVLARTTDPPQRVAPAAASVEKFAGVLAIATGTAALGVATYYGFRAHAASVDVERAYAAGGRGADIVERDAEGRHAATAARVFGIGGLVAIASGVTLVIVGKRAERAAGFAIGPSSTDTRVSYTWQF